MQKRVIVTGASGHIGFHVALQLLKAGYEITLLIRKENSNVIILKNVGANVFTTDFLNPDSYKKIIENADVLFHVASENSTDTSNEKKIIDNTFGLTKNVIDACVAAKVKTIIYTSSVVVLGRSSDRDILINENDETKNLQSPYVKGKFLAEQYCNKIIAEKKADIRRMYPSWVVGSNDVKLTPPHKIIKNFVQNGQWFYCKGGISIASAEEVAKAHVNAWLNGKPFEKYILAGENISFKEFYTTLAGYSKKKKPFVFVPKLIVYVGAITLQFFLGKKNPVNPKYVSSVVGNFSWYSSDKAVKELGYCIPLADTILSEAVTAARQKIIGLDKLIDQQNQSLKKIFYEPNDVLLITGFPGWLGNRMTDILMNGDKFGNNAVSRKIKLLVLPKYEHVISMPSNFEIVYGDVTDKKSVTTALKNVKAVYHLAGVVYPKNTRLYNEVNYQGTKNLVDACVENGVRRILFMSSDSICGYGRDERIFNDKTISRPYKQYGRSKYLAEKYILDKTREGLIDGTSLRGFWFFGPFMPKRTINFFSMLFQKRQIVFGNGKNFRSISHLDNITEAFIKAEKNSNTTGKWYWIGNKKPDLTVDDIYTNLSKGLGVDYRPFYIPKFVCELCNAADSLISISGKINSSLHAAGKFHKDIAGEISAAEEDFGYDPKAAFKQITEEISQELTKNF